jgi:hypothetical protein
VGSVVLVVPDRSGGSPELGLQLGHGIRKDGRMAAAHQGEPKRPVQRRQVAHPEPLRLSLT